MKLAPRDVGGVLVALVVAIGCVRLGLWQLDRLRQRQDRNSAIRAARARPPLDVTGALAPDTARDRRLHAHGVFDYAHEQVWRARTYEGLPGVALITPLRLADGAAVLVDRGWALSPDAYHVDQRAYREADTADVLGLGMLAPRARGDVDPTKLRDSIPYSLLPFVIQQLPESALRTPTGQPPDRPTAAVRRWPPPELSNGPHLSYAIQWFSFAAIVVVGTVALLRKRGETGPGPPQGYH